VSFLDYIWGKRPDTEPASPEKPALVTCGIYLSGRDYFLCAPGNEAIRGVKIVTVPRELYERYLAAEKGWLAVQGELVSLPKSLRPRKRRVVS
jgi:hypothetical protein